MFFFYFLKLQMLWVEFSVPVVLVVQGSYGHRDFEVYRYKSEVRGNGGKIISNLICYFLLL